MTIGAAILAINNESIDYVSMARWSAERIHRHLNLPVCLITDQSIDDTVFDHVITINKTPTDSKRHFEDQPALVTWYNQDRASILELTPWDQTVILDADYVVASDSLLPYLDSDHDILCHDRAYSVTSKDGYLEHLNSFGSVKMPMLWATVMIIRKTKTTQMIFQMMDMVRMNWRHYCDVYGIGRSPYRNDWALSIAHLVVNGHVLPRNNLPWNLASVLPEHKLEQIDQDAFRVTWKDAQQLSRYVILSGMDFHAMCKATLGDIVAHHG